jgi:tRNA A37 threonylcarbamoyladenosine biosynthesis protein TsaE
LFSPNFEISKSYEETATRILHSDYEISQCKTQEFWARKPGNSPLKKQARHVIERLLS